MNLIKKISAVLLLAPALSLAAPVAMITDLKGKVTLTDGTASRPALLLTYLEPANRLQLEAGAQIVLTYFAKPMEITLAGPAEATIAADGVNVSKGAKPAVRNLDAARVSSAKTFEPVARERLALATVQMRTGTRPAPRPTYPADTAILSVTPALEWAELPGVSGYRVTLADAAGKNIIDQTVARPPFAIPQDKALQAGGAYAWRVETTLAGGATASGEAKFSVLDAARAKTLKAAQPKAGDSFSRRVLYAAQLESAGLRDDARRLWQTLSNERPDDEALKQWASN